MTVVEKIRQLLALAASTTFAGERDSALAKARLLFNKHQVADARLRWELAWCNGCCVELSRSLTRAARLQNRT